MIIRNSLRQQSVLCLAASRSPCFRSTRYSSTFHKPNQSLKCHKFRFGISPRTKCSMSSQRSLLTERQAQPLDGVLAARADDHGGVTVEMTDEPMDAHDFISLLRSSISLWRQQGKKGVWLKLPIKLVNLVEPAVQEGFYYHHAEPSYLMLVQWLPTTANTLPVNASHRVGIGAFVVNEKHEVLVVQERSGQLGGSGVWKMPTGVVDAGEDIGDAAIREVKEETGIDTKFMEILAFSQRHNLFFGKSDLAFLCLLQPLSFDIQMQEAEIEAAKWMSFEDYAAQPFIQEHGTLKKVCDICSAKKDGRYTGFSAVATVTGFSQKNTYLFCNVSGRAS